MSREPTETLPRSSRSGEGDIDPPSVLGGRYKVGQRIGRGGFGTVFVARDTQYECDVAIKVLRNTDADALYRFKGEFRSVADISHPNLLRLYELGVDDALWFVVMELVDGVDLRRWVWTEEGSKTDHSVLTAPRGSLTISEPRTAPRVDRDRLRVAFAQLARGLVAVHEAGKLHRDLKPSNVLVAKDGHLRILDFGLVLEAHEKPGVLTGRGIGTPGYMAPEQIRGGTLTPAADWYSVGAMLYETLTGSVPGSEAPFLLLPDDDLGTLCRSLLEHDPAKRAGADALAFLEPKTVQFVRTAPTSTIVGREKELAALDDAWSATERSALATCLVGSSGVGKSTLLDAWIQRARAAKPEREPLVLRGRCLEHENVPFKAIDGVIDALAAYLAETEDTERPSLHAAIRMFPVLAHHLERTVEDDTGDPIARRERALACLKEVLVHLTRKQELIICIYDVQWADVEGLRALADLIEPTTPGLFLVLSQRPSVEMSRVIEQCLASVALPSRRIELEVLDDSDALALARMRVGEAMAARVVREAAGNPFLIHQLADYHRTGSSVEGPIEIADLVSKKIDRVGPAGRELVEVVALAASPLAERVLIDAAALGGADARTAMQAVEQDRLVAGARVDGTVMFTTLHDRVREEVVRQIAPTRLQSLHGRIASALTMHGFDAPEVLLHHYLGAEDREAATGAAVRAAQHAEEVLAFERAAEHYGTILRLGQRSEETSRLHEQRGTALSNAGRAAEAAAALQESARTFGIPKSRDDVRTVRSLNRRSGELWLRSGHVDAGKALLAECLAQIGRSMPKSASSALFASARRRLWFFVRGFNFKPRQESEIAPDELERLDIMWGATTSLAMLDYVVADSINIRHLLEALRLGERKRVLRSLSFEVGLEAVIGGAFLEKHSAKLIERMERLSAEIDEPYLRAWISMTRGVVAWSEASFVDSWNYCNQATTIFRRDTRGTTWELAVTDVYGLSSLSYIGDIPMLARIVPDAHRIARERGDRYATANLAFFESFVDLANDNPIRARSLIERALEPFPKSKYLSIHYGLAYAMAQTHLYEDAAESAWKLVEEEYPSWKKGGMLGVRTAKIEVRYLRARVALAMLEKVPGHAGATKRLAEDQKLLEREKSSFAKAVVLAIRAARANLAKARDEAITLLDQAGSAFKTCDLNLHAGAARRHSERLRGETPTTTLPHIASSERMSHLLLAGFRV